MDRVDQVLDVLRFAEDLEEREDLLVCGLNPLLGELVLLPFELVFDLIENRKVWILVALRRRHRLRLDIFFGRGPILVGLVSDSPLALVLIDGGLNLDAEAGGRR